MSAAAAASLSPAAAAVRFFFCLAFDLVVFPAFDLVVFPAVDLVVLTAAALVVFTAAAFFSASTFFSAAAIELVSTGSVVGTIGVELSILIDWVMTTEEPLLQIMLEFVQYTLNSCMFVYCVDVNNK